MTEEAEKAEQPRKPSIVQMIPRIAKLVYHLARDPRVPWTVKASLVAMAAYLASPIDLIPDWIPGAGYVDDVLVVAIVLNYVFAKVPEDVIIEHWGEDVELLDKLRRRPRRKKRTEDTTPEP